MNWLFWRAQNNPLKEIQWTKRKHGQLNGIRKINAWTKWEVWQKPLKQKSRNLRVEDYHDRTEGFNVVFQQQT